MKNIFGVPYLKQINAPLLLSFHPRLPWLLQQQLTIRPERCGGLPL